MTIIVVLVVVFLVAVLAFKSIHLIGPAQIGLVNKRFALRKLPEDNPIAFRGEAGYQATMLMPGLRFRLWPIFSVQKFPWVQVPGGEIGVVIAQVGAPLPIGAKSGVYRSEFGNFSELETFIRRRRAEGRAASGAAARDADADPSGRVPGPHPGTGVRRAGVARHRGVDARERRDALAAELRPDVRGVARGA